MNDRNDDSEGINDGDEGINDGNEGINDGDEGFDRILIMIVMEKE